MPIVRINPWRNSMLNSFLNESNWPTMSTDTGLDVYEENGKVIVHAVMPSLEDKDVNVSYEDGVLSMNGHSSQSEEERRENRTYHKMELNRSFSYTTTLPRPVDPASIKASLSKGVLEIVASISPEAKLHKIEVKSA